MKKREPLALEGKRFGNLVALKGQWLTRGRKGKTTDIYWECRCDCGEICLVKEKSLLNGKRTTCGHCRGLKPGDKIGRLTLIEVDHSTVDKSNAVTKYWLCECDCGNYKVINGKHIAQHNTLSCGCLDKEQATRQGKLNKKYNEYHIVGNEVIGLTSKGGPFIFDLDDFELVKSYCWRLDPNGYVETSINNYGGIQPKYSNLKLHRMIMNCPDGLVVDHINHNCTDNRKQNLRIVTQTENRKNARLSKSNKSGCTGVIKSEYGWTATLKHDGVTRLNKAFKTFKEAVEARKQAERDYFGEFQYQSEQDYVNSSPKTDGEILWNYYNDLVKEGK